MVILGHHKIFSYLCRKNNHMNNQFSFRLLWEWHRKDILQSLGYLFVFCLCVGILVGTTMRNEMEVYVTKKYIVPTGIRRYPYLIDFRYDGHHYTAVCLDKDKWDTMKVKQNNHINLQYANYNDFALAFFVFSFVSAAILIPLVSGAIATLKDCIDNTRAWTSWQKQKQLDSF